MALTTYSELKAELVDWLARPDLTTKAATFIALFEADLRPKTSALESLATSVETTVAGTATLELSTTAKQVVALAFADASMPPLVQTSPQALLESDKSKLSGVPSEFALTGPREVTFARIPDAAYDVKVVVRENFDPLSASNTTNWILDEFPNLYLYGSLGHAKAYMQDSQIGEVNTMYAPALADFMTEINRRKLAQGTPSFNKRFL